MKSKFLLLLPLLLLQNKVINAQVEIWNWQGDSIGANATGDANCAMGAMPDVALIDSQYIMYYIARYNNVNAIYYATSPDMSNWAVQDTIMTASEDTTNRIYDLGGPGILKLNNGQYRLFYRTAQKRIPPNEPLFHIRSMISNDGIHFTHEGIRIDNKTYDPTSYFKSASHPAVYKDIFGNTKAIITGRDTTMNINSPAGLYTASSPDEGLTWTNFAPLYEKCHDPVVIKDSLNIYHMYTSYMGSGHREAISLDGITWPVAPDSMLLQQGTIPLNESNSAYIIADLGAAVDSLGNIVLYSNHKTLGPGAWTNVAYFHSSNSVNTITKNANDEFIVFPNPSSNSIKISESTFSKINQFKLVS